MATGQFTLLQGEPLGDEVIVPVWRYPNDLCYIQKPANGLLGKEKYRQVMLCTINKDGSCGKPRCISKSWPKIAKQGWLESK